MPVVVRLGPPGPRSHSVTLYDPRSIAVAQPCRVSSALVEAAHTAVPAIAPYRLTSKGEALHSEAASTGPGTGL